MMREQRAVQSFHEQYGLDVAYEPQQLDSERLNLRMRLMREELNEFLDAALGGLPLQEQAKELSDLLYVVLGTAVEMGFDLGHVFNQTHESNMSKLWDIELAKSAVDHPAEPADQWEYTPDERKAIVRDKYGKALKPPTYRPPTILVLPPTD